METQVQAAMMVIGLGAGRRWASPEGLGAIGPYGNVDAVSALSPNTNYQITGTGVALRNPLVDGLSESGVLQRLNTGDVVSVGDTVRSSGAADSQGQFVNFAWVTAGNQQGYVATEYLAPSGTIQPAPVSNVSTVTTTDITHDSSSSSTFDSVKNFISKNSTPILIGAGLLGVGIVAMAVMGGKKGKRRKGHHSAHRHAHHRH